MALQRTRRAVCAAAAAAGFLIAAPAAARIDVCYGGGLSLPNFSLNGTATLSSTTNDVLLTTNALTQIGTVFYDTPFTSTNDLHVELTARITNPVTSGADGMAFVLTSAPSGPASIGNAGGDIGYGGITPSVVVELDTYKNAWDPNANHVAVTLNGDSNHGDAVNAGLPVVDLGTLSPPVTLQGSSTTVWVDYTAATTTLAVYVSAGTVKPLVPALTTTAVNLKSVVGSSFYIGVTGSTGGSAEQNELVSFYASDGGQPGDACCTPPTGAQCLLPPGSTLGPVCDPVKDVCGPCDLGNTASCPTGMSACDVSKPDNVCVATCTGDFGSGGANACPSANFPVCSTTGATAGSCVACDGDNTTSAPFTCGTTQPTCLASGYCGACATSADCTTGGITHAGPVCNTTTGVCGACTTDAQCASGDWCDAGACIAKLPNGAQMPTVAGHTPPLDGQCNPTEATAVCASGVCDTTNQTCGYLNGDGIPGATALTPTPASDCDSGVVDATDGLCGYANGDGIAGASSATPTPVADCRSGAVDPGTGLCGYANGDGATGASGSSPTPPSECISGVVDAKDGLCGYANGDGVPGASAASPTPAGDCRSGAVDPKTGLCGYANGDGIPGASATNPTPPNECASGVIDGTDGLCGFLNGDGASDATASSPTPVSDCRSGVVDPSDGLCGLVNGGVCVTGTGCRSGACNLGLCGPASASSSSSSTSSSSSSSSSGAGGAIGASSSSATSSSSSSSGAGGATAASSSSSSSSSSSGAGGEGGASSSSASGSVASTSGSTGSSAASSGAGGAMNNNGVQAQGGCTCTAAGGSDPLAPVQAAGLFAMLGAMLSRRRRRS